MRSTRPHDATVYQCGAQAAARPAVVSATGTASQDEELRVPIESSLSEQCVSKAHAVVYPDTEAQPAIFAQLCHQCGTKSLLAAPVLHDSNVVGVLELRSDRADSFHETD